MPPAPPPAKVAQAQEDDHAVPKAIAIDPAQAMAIMAKAQAAEAAAKAAEKEKNKPPPPPATTTPPPAPVAPSLPVPPTPAVAKTPDNAPPPPAPAGTDTSRFITVSLKAPAQAPNSTPKVASLLDMATLDQAGTGAAGATNGIRLDEVDRAVIDAFMKEWLPPDASKLRVDQRTAHLDMAIDRTGRVLNFKLTQPSGSIDLDMSVLEAADRLDKIGAQLPASFPKERYEFQVNLHAE
jgi:outer membrane biosynthesis protein TonB